MAVASLFFFFSSRRRHTRLQGDWSSDVCSSDLVGLKRQERGAEAGGERRFGLGHSALRAGDLRGVPRQEVVHRLRRREASDGRDRKSTRLNSSHLVISYAVFCLKKKKQK